MNVICLHYFSRHPQNRSFETGTSFAWQEGWASGASRCCLLSEPARHACFLLNRAPPKCRAYPQHALLLHRAQIGGFSALFLGLELYLRTEHDYERALSTAAAVRLASALTLTLSFVDPTEPSASC